jgi:glycosidase
MFLGYHILIKFYKNGELTNDFPKESYRYYEKNAIDGDLQGVIKELDYLKELGIDLIYLGPIFKSKTTHGYDITNYFSISENISSNSEEDAKAIFKKLIEDAHKRGIKVIIDLVLNHASKEFDFNSVPKDLNIKTESPRSPQEERWQRSFLFWNLDDEDTREFLIRVGEYWLKNFELDGFRLDHALGLPLNFLEEFSIRMKKIKKDVIILGEVWEDEGDKLKNFNLLKKFKGDDAQRFTSMFDFATYDTIKEVLGKKNGSLLELYNQIVLSNQLNEKEFQLTYFIENHDLPRFVDICQDIETFYIALGLLMTLTGNVMLEYGNEIALKGDPTIQNFHESGRVAMKFKEDWSDLEKQTFNYCKNLINLRKVHLSLSSGSYELNTSEENLLIFEKQAAYDEIKVLIYTGEQEYQLDKEYFDLIRDTKVLKLKKGIYYLQ